MVYHVLAFAFAELVDNALAATAGNKGLRKIEIQLVRNELANFEACLIYDFYI